MLRSGRSAASNARRRATDIAEAVVARRRGLVAGGVGPAGLPLRPWPMRRRAPKTLDTLDELILILALTVAGGVFAGAEIAVVALRKTRVQELLDEGRRGAAALERLRRDPERFLASVQVGITVIGATAAAVGGASLAERLTPWIQRAPWLAPYAEDIALGAVVIAVSFLSIVVGELVPK